MSDFINLRVYSHYSKFKSVIKIKQLLNFAQENNHFAIGLCDYNFFGAVKFTQSAIKNKIKPILGVLIPVENIGFLPIYAKSNKGYQCLSYLVSRLSIYDTKATIEDLSKLEDVVVLTGDKSIFYSNFSDQWERILTRLKDIFSDDLYIELIPYMKYQKLLPLADKLNISVVVTYPSQMSSYNNRKSLYTIQLIDKVKYYDEDEFKNFKPEGYLRNRSDFHIQEAIENTKIIAQKCSFFLEPKEPIIPKISDDEENDLRRMSMDRLKEKLLDIPEDKHEIYYQRLEKELKVLIDKKFCGYFLVTADFVSYALNNNIGVGPGRGSGAGSLVAYVLGITNVDPIKFELIFERFLNPERNSMPDFDIDFDPQGRGKIIEYLKVKYGKYNIANIITYGTYHSKGLIQALCKVFRIPFVQALKITKLIPFNAVRPVTLEEALSMVPELAKYAQEYPHIFELCRDLEGIMRNISKHAAGMIISNGPIYQQCPLIKEGNGLITQFDYRDMEKIGGVKFDFLGLITLSLLEDTVKKIGIKVNDIPLDDPETFKLFQEAKYLEGVFQFESSFMRSILKSMKPTNINDLIAVNALGRPGPMAYIPKYIQGKKDPSSIVYDHPLLEEILSSTFGVLVYQEQVMSIACKLGGYSMAQADILRRAMGKKKEEEMNKQRVIFVDGCKNNQISEEVANKIFDQMSEFSSYGFNKGHSTPYAILGYKCAYLKTHYPLEFISTCINLENNNKEKVCRYIAEFKSMGYQIIGPDINDSMEESMPYNEKYIKMGLSSVKNTNLALVNNIVEQRNKKCYENIYDFVQRNINYLNKKNWDCLVYSGAMKIWGNNEDLIDNFQALRRGEAIVSSENPLNIQDEKLGMGFYINHPIQLIPEIKLTHGIAASKIKSNCTILVGGSILKYTMKSSKSKKSFGILELQDNHGIIDITCFNKTAENKALKDGNFIIASVNVESKITNRFIANKIWSVDEYLEKNGDLKVEVFNKQQINSLIKVIKENQGSNGLKILVDNRYIKTPSLFKDSLLVRKKIQDMDIRLIQ